MKGLKRIFTGTLPLFLLLWAMMMGFLGWINGEKHAADVQAAVNSAQETAEAYYETIQTKDTPEAQKPVILSSWLDNSLPPYAGVIQFCFYDADGQELSRSPIVQGRASFGPWANYRWVLLLDPVLSPEEQVDLAQRLTKESSSPQTQSLSGDVKGLSLSNGLIPEEGAGEYYCTVVGVTDPERRVIYPKSITYVYNDQKVTVLDNNSDFFEGKTLSTTCVDSVQLFSALVGRNVSPQELLRQWQEVEQRVDILYAGTGDLPSTYTSASDGSSAYCFPLSDGSTLVYAYSYNPLSLIVEDLWPTALFTLLAAVAMALFTDHRQRRALQRERDFARAAAHELKTPLAVLRAHAEALQENIAPEKREQYLDVVLSESDRMAALVGHLLELSRPEVKGKPNKTPVELAPLVQEVFAPLALPLEQKQLQLQLELEEVSLNGDLAQLREAVENLASNALRYAAPGGTIQVTLARAGSRARLTVYNDGPNIPVEDLPRLWEPFYRADPSRSRDSGGTGLGLTIVRKTVEAHHGQCWAENRSGGVAFVLEFPLV